MLHRIVQLNNSEQQELAISALFLTMALGSTMTVLLLFAAWVHDAFAWQRVLVLIVWASLTAIPSWQLTPMGYAFDRPVMAMLTLLIGNSLQVWIHHLFDGVSLLAIAYLTLSVLAAMVLLIEYRARTRPC